MNHRRTDDERQETTSARLQTCTLQPGEPAPDLSNTPFAFAAHLASGALVLAVTITGLAAELSNDPEAYAQAVHADDPLTTLGLRVDTLDELTTFTQSAEVHRWLAAHPDTELNEDALTMLLTPKAGPVAQCDQWPNDAPVLHLLRTQYAPFTDVAMPQGTNILWLDPSDELVFVHACVKLGIINRLDVRH